MLPLPQTIALVALFALGVAVAFRAAATARTPQGAVAWVVFLVSAPYLALPLWLFLGSAHYRGYYIARRDSEKLAGGLHRYANAHAPRAHESEADFRAFEPIGKLPVVCGNDADLLVNGQQIFDAIFAAIDDAERYILVQFYTIRDDGLGRRFRDKLIEAARRGVSVRLLYDQVGSHSLPERYCRELREGGVIVMDPRRSRGPRTRFRVNFRNHRKTVVIDGRVGFLGGANVSDIYLGQGRHFDQWRDTQLRLVGPIVSQLQLVFCEDWHWAMEETLFDGLEWQVEEQPADIEAVLLPTGPGDDLETGSLYYFALIAAARQRIWIATPYFVPDTAIVSALIHAALRGVEVRILVPEGIDHWMPWLAAFAYFDDVRTGGVEIWRYQPGFMHQKVVLVDDRIAAVGTTNMDNRSFRLNFEAAVVMFDREKAREVEAMLTEDFAVANRMTKALDEHRLAIRIGAPVARLFAPLL